MFLVDHFARDRRNQARKGWIFLNLGQRSHRLPEKKKRKKTVGLKNDKGKGAVTSGRDEPFGRAGQAVIKTIFLRREGRVTAKGVSFRQRRREGGVHLQAGTGDRQCYLIKG